MWGLHCIAHLQLALHSEAVEWHALHQSDSCCRGQVNVVQHFSSWAAAGHALSSKVGLLRRQAADKAAAALPEANRVPDAAPNTDSSASSAGPVQQRRPDASLSVADLPRFVEAMRYLTIRHFLTCSQVGSWQGVQPCAAAAASKLALPATGRQPGQEPPLLQPSLPPHPNPRR